MEQSSVGNRLKVQENIGTIVGGANTGTINQISYHLKRQALRPNESPPRYAIFPEPIREYRQLLQKIRQHLNSEGCVVVYGPSGSEKTKIAGQYWRQFRAEEHYPGGVLWVNIERSLNTAHILRNWARYSLGIDELLLKQIHKADNADDLFLQQMNNSEYSPGDVKFLLSQSTGLMLVVFDNLLPEFFPLIESLIDVLPAEAHIIITALEPVSFKYIRPALIEIGKLSDQEARDIVESIKIEGVSQQQIAQLVESVDGDLQALTLDIGLIQGSESDQRPELIEKRVLLTSAVQTDLHSPRGKDFSPRSLSLEFSYQNLGEVHGEIAQQRFRFLGILDQTGADISRTMIAALWDLSIDAPELDQLIGELQTRQILLPTTEQRWTLRQAECRFALKELRAAHEEEIAEQRYTDHIIMLLQQLFDAPYEQFAAFDPDRPHLFHIGRKLVREARTQLVGMDYFESALPNKDAFDESVQELMALALHFVVYSTISYIHYPELAGVTELELRTGLVIASIYQHYTIEWQLLISGARYFLDREQYSEGLRLAKRAAELAYDKLSEEKDFALWAELLTGIACISIGQIDKSEDYIRRAIALVDSDQVLLRARLHNELTEVLLILERFEEAKHCIEPILHEIEDLPENTKTPNPELAVLIIRTLNNLGTAQSQLAELQVAEKTFARAEKIAKDIDPIVLMQLQLNKAGVYTAINRFDSAKEILDNTFAQSQDIHAPVIQFQVLSALSNLHQLRGESDSARRYMQEALALLQDSKQFHKQRCDAYIALARIDISQKSYDNALERLKSALDIAIKTAERSRMIMLLEHIHRVFENTSRFSEGLAFFEATRNRISGIPTVELTIFGCMTNLSLNTGDLEHALRYFLEIPERIDDIQIETAEEQLMTFFTVGVVNAMRGQIENAIFYLEKAVPLAHRLRETYFEVNITSILGVLALRNSEIEKAQSYLDTLESLMKENDNPDIRVRSINLQGQLCLATQKFSEGIALFQEGKNIAQQHHDNLLASVISMNLGFAYWLDDQIDESIAALNSASQQAQRLGAQTIDITCRINKGLIVGNGLNRYSEGIEIIERGLAEMEQSNIDVLSDGMTPEFVRVLLQSMRDQAERGSETRPVEDLLQVVLRATNWSIAELATHSGRDVLLQPNLLAVLDLEMKMAQERKRYETVEILGTYRKILSWCREESISIAYQRAREQMETESVYVWWARVHRSQREYAAALLKINRAIELNPNSAKAWIERGWIYRGIGRYNLALDDYNKALQYSPEHARALLGIGVISLEVGQLEQARRNLDNAIRQEPDYAYHYHWRACVRRELLDFIGALDDFDRARNLDKNDYTHSYWYALTQLELEQTEAALHQFDLLCEHEAHRPQDLAYNQIWRGYSLHLLGKHKDANDAWAEARETISSLSQGSSRQFAEALAFLVCNNVNEALKIYEQLLTLRQPHHLFFVHLRHARMLARIEIQRPERQMALQQVEKLMLQNYAVK